MRRSLIIFLIALIINIVCFPIMAELDSEFSLTSEERSYLDSIKDSDIKLATGSYLNYFTSEDGKREGMMAPLVDILIDDWGLSVEAFNTQWDEAFQKLDKNEIDLFGLGILSDSRREKYYTTNQLYKSNMDVYTKVGKGLTNITDLKGKTVGMLSNSVLHDIVKTYISTDGDIKSYPNVKMLLAALENDEVYCVAAAGVIHKELMAHPKIQYSITLESAIAPQGIYTNNKKYEPLIKIINRYLTTADGEKLVSEINLRRREAIFDLYRDRYADDIKYLSDNYKEIDIFNSGGLYPLAFVWQDKCQGLQNEINKVFYELTGIDVKLKSVENLENGIDGALEIIKNGGDGVAITGVYYNNMSKEDSTYSLSVPLATDKLGFYVRQGETKSSLADMQIGTTIFGVNYIDWKTAFGKMPKIYDTREDLMAAVNTGEIDAVFSGEMSIDYLYTVLNDYTFQQFGNISLPVQLHMLYNSENESFNNLMDMSIMLNAMLNPVERYVWTDTSQNGKFDLMRLRNSLISFQNRTVHATVIFIAILAILLVLVVFQLKKFSEYDRQITKMLSTQGNVDMLWGDVKKTKLISKGGFPIFKKWGLDAEFCKTLYNDKVIEESRIRLEEEGVQFCKRELKIKIPNDDAVNYIELYTHKINDRKYMLFALDTTAERYREKELNRIANTDFLTKLLSRRAMDSRLLEMSNELSSDDSRVFIFMLDIDDFKNINDSYGHDIGDKVLVITAQVIRDFVGEDYAARWGGEEFLAIFKAESLERAIETADAILKELARQKIRVGSRLAFNVTISCGISEMIKNEKYEDTVIRADKALYMAKSDGKNCVRIVNIDDKVDTVFVYKKNKKENSLVYNKVISRIIKAFFYSSDVKNVINKLLEIVVENTGANSAGLFEKVGDSGLLCTYFYTSDSDERNNEGINAEYANTDWDINSPMFVSDTALIETNSELPHNLKAYVRLPLFTNDDFKGVIQFNNFDEPYEWSMEERHIFTDVSVIIGEILIKKNIENQIINDEALFIALDSVNDIVYVVERESGKLLFVNKKFCEKISDSDIIGKKCWEVIYPNNSSKCALCQHNCLSRENGIVTVKNKMYNESLDSWLEMTNSLVSLGDGAEAVIVVCKNEE